jgi:hypothetical protein
MNSLNFSRKVFLFIPEIIVVVVEAPLKAFTALH